MSAGGSSSSTDKVRFDLKQISQWDKQNKQDYEKKIQQKGIGSQTGVGSQHHHHQGQHRHHHSSRDDTDQDNASGYKYRDRALERRKDLNGLVTNTH